MAKDPAKCDVDPVCMMDLSGMHGKFAYEFEDETYYFCSELCKEHFAKEPEKYSKNLETSGAP
jgi:YHS domain-containing protein